MQMEMEMEMEIQVDKSHYAFEGYVSKERWASLWHQLDEICKLKPRNVLEIGPGPGLFKATAAALGLHVQTLDLDPNLKPDHISSVFSMAFENGAFDVVCAFQMLEHIPWEKSLDAFSEMNRVSNNAIVISIPDAARCLRMSAYIPRLGQRWIHIPIPRWSNREHHFDGQHYWEINKSGYSTNFVINEFQKLTEKKLHHTFRVNENPYHRFLIWKK
jgi:hypothetical protein